MSELAGDAGVQTVARVRESLAGSLEPGETVESAFFGQRYPFGLTLLLWFGTIAEVVYVFVARPYYVALTSRRFFLLKGTWGAPGEPIFSIPADSVRMDRPRRFIAHKTTTIRSLGGEEVRIAVRRVYWRELEYMHSLVSG